MGEKVDIVGVSANSDWSVDNADGGNTMTNKYSYGHFKILPNAVCQEVSILF